MRLLLALSEVVDEDDCYDAPASSATREIGSENTHRPPPYTQSYISKLPIRQLTDLSQQAQTMWISKLPIRQLTLLLDFLKNKPLSKLPIRQLTCKVIPASSLRISKLPIRQLT